jgi:hypothetical protein
MSTENLFDYTQKNYMRAPVFPGLETTTDVKKPAPENKGGK